MKLAIFPDEARIYNLKSPKKGFRTVLRLLYYLSLLSRIHTSPVINAGKHPSSHPSLRDTFPIQGRLTDSPPKADEKLETGNWELICEKLWAGGLMGPAEG